VRVDHQLEGIGIEAVVDEFLIEEGRELRTQVDVLEEGVNQVLLDVVGSASTPWPLLHLGHVQQMNDNQFPRVPEFLKDLVEILPE
jgi:hypothetical protein